MRRLWARLREWRLEAFGQPTLSEDGLGFRTVKLPPLDDTREGTVPLPDPDDDRYVIVPVQTPDGEIRWRVPREPLTIPTPENVQEPRRGAENESQPLKPHGEPLTPTDPQN